MSLKSYGYREVGSPSGRQNGKDTATSSSAGRGRVNLGTETDGAALMLGQEGSLGVLEQYEPRMAPAYPS